MLLPSEDVRALLRAAAPLGLQERERVALARALESRDVAMEAGVRGEPLSAAAAADAELREAAARALASAARLVRFALPTRADAQPGLPGWEAELHRFLTALLCSSRDASADERALAARTSAACCEGVRAQAGPLRGRVAVQSALIALFALRRVLEDEGGCLRYAGASLLHRAALHTFSSETVCANASRARAAALCANGSVDFDTAIGMLADQRGA